MTPQHVNGVRCTDCGERFRSFERFEDPDEHPCQDGGHR